MNIAGIGSRSGWPRLTYRQEWAVRLVILAAVLVGFSFVCALQYLDRTTEEQARQGIVAMVARVPNVRMGGITVNDPTVLLEALRSVADVPAQHSHPTAPVRLELRSGAEVMTLEIARDSDRPAEFWVFRPGPNWHGDPLGEYAGRVISPELNEYLGHRAR